MIDEWYSAWVNYHGYECSDALAGDQSSIRSPVRRFTERGDTRNVWQSLAEFDDAVTSWIGSRRKLTWIMRPQWTAHFTIECELAADWLDERKGEK